MLQVTWAERWHAVGAGAARLGSARRRLGPARRRLGGLAEYGGSAQLDRLGGLSVVEKVEAVATRRVGATRRLERLDAARDERLRCVLKSGRRDWVLRIRAEVVERHRWFLLRTDKCEGAQLVLNSPVETCVGARL